MSKFRNKFDSIDEKSLDRKRNTREERKVKEDLPKIVFSFKDFDVKQIPPGQSYKDWQHDELLAYMVENLARFVNITLLRRCNKILLKHMINFRIFRASNILKP